MHLKKKALTFEKEINDLTKKISVAKLKVAELQKQLKSNADQLTTTAKQVQDLTSQGTDSGKLSETAKAGMDKAKAAFTQFLGLLKDQLVGEDKDLKTADEASDVLFGKNDLKKCTDNINSILP